MGAKSFPPNPLLEEARRLRLKKRMSQNFLVDATVLAAIVETVQPQPTDHVLEIGPGAGFLTERLAPRVASLTAVELDRDMVALLQRKWAETPSVSVIHQDIMKFPLEELPWPRFKVVGNLPYHITSLILFRLAGELHQAEYPLRQRLEGVTLMVQKEVGERITARPHCKGYNALSIALQFWFETRLEFVVPAAAFYPAPKVESAIITLTPRPEPAVAVDDLPGFARLVKTAFSSRRKTVRNALLQGQLASAALLDKMFDEAQVNSGLRAEALSMEDFARLANALYPRC